MEEEYILWKKRSSRVAGGKKEEIEEKKLAVWEARIKCTLERSQGRKGPWKLKSEEETSRGRVDWQDRR